MERMDSFVPKIQDGLFDNLFQEANSKFGKCHQLTIQMTRPIANLRQMEGKRRDVPRLHLVSRIRIPSCIEFSNFGNRYEVFRTWWRQLQRDDLQQPNDEVVQRADGQRHLAAIIIILYFWTNLFCFEYCTYIYWVGRGDKR